MKVKILRHFCCSSNGQSHDLKPGDVAEVPDRLIAQLTSDGYVAACASEAVIEKSLPEESSAEPPPSRRGRNQKAG